MLVAKGLFTYKVTGYKSVTMLQHKDEEHVLGDMKRHYMEEVGDQHVLSLPPSAHSCLIIERVGCLAVCMGMVGKTRCMSEGV